VAFFSEKYHESDICIFKKSFFQPLNQRFLRFTNYKSKRVTNLSDKDTYAKNYMADNTVFADAFNFLIYDGRQVINPDDLKPLDTSVLTIPFGNNNATVPVQKIRDLLKKAEIKEDGDNIYLILGMENQSEIHYAIPARNMLYDSLEYARQIENTAKAHRKSRDYKDVSAGEFLSGFYKNDKLIPVITLVIYFGADEWTAPRSIYDMLNIKNKEILSFVNNYQINLISPFDIDDKNANKLHSSLREVLLYIKNSNDKEKLMNLLQNDKRFSKLEREAVYIINAFTNSNLKIDKNQEVFDMCQAIKELIEDGRLEGKLEGKLEGIRALIKAYKKFGASLSDTIKDVSSEFKITEAEAENRVKEIW